MQNPTHMPDELACARTQWRGHRSRRRLTDRAVDRVPCQGQPKAVRSALEVPRRHRDVAVVAHLPARRHPQQASCCRCGAGGVRGALGGVGRTRQRLGGGKGGRRDAGGGRGGRAVVHAGVVRGWARLHAERQAASARRGVAAQGRRWDDSAGRSVATLAQQLSRRVARSRGEDGNAERGPPAPAGGVRGDHEQPLPPPPHRAGLGEPVKRGSQRRHLHGGGGGGGGGRLCGRAAGRRCVAAAGAAKRRASARVRREMLQNVRSLGGVGGEWRTGVGGARWVRGGDVHAAVELHPQRGADGVGRAGALGPHLRQAPASHIHATRRSGAQSAG